MLEPHPPRLWAEESELDIRLLPFIQADAILEEEKKQKELAFRNRLRTNRNPPPAGAC